MILLTNAKHAKSAHRLTLEVTGGRNVASMEGAQSAALSRHVDRKVKARFYAAYSWGAENLIELLSLETIRSAASTLD